MPNKSFYAIIPAFVRYDRVLSANAKLLYGEITALCNERGYCWASNDYFSELYGVSKKSISSWISQLENRGYIEREIIYKEGTKEVQSRHIRLKTEESTDGASRKNPLYPMEDHEAAYGCESQGALEENGGYPIEEKVKENNKVINNTMNKTKDNKGVADKTALHSIIDTYTLNESLRACILDFIEMREAMKKPVTSRALRLLLDQLDPLAQTDEKKIKILEQSILNCWQGVFPLKESREEKRYSKADIEDDPYNPFNL